MVNRLQEILAYREIELSAKINIVRNGYEHNLTKGEAIENIVRDLLKEYLPESLGITSGQIIDSYAHISKQVDIIIYDAQSYPKFLTTGSSSLIPVEAVVAVVECKTNLTSDELQKCIDNCKSVKELIRDAYINSEIHQRDIYFTVFAFDSNSCDNITDHLNECEKYDPVNVRINTILSLCNDNKSFFITNWDYSHSHTMDYKDGQISTIPSVVSLRTPIIRNVLSIWLVSLLFSCLNDINIIKYFSDSYPVTIEETTKFDNNFLERRFYYYRMVSKLDDNATEMLAHDYYELINGGSDFCNINLFDKEDIDNLRCIALHNSFSAFKSIIEGRRSPSDA